MKRFKLKQGNADVYDISKESYTYKGKDGKKRCFAVCPACDNPIQIIGMYVSLKNTDKPFGKHYNRDTKIAKHNKITYQFCPYAAHVYNSPEVVTKSEYTDFEKGIYQTLRDNFDYSIYMMENILGLKINITYAQNILQEYLSVPGHMYYAATYYNIPWMLMYFMGVQPCYNKMVKEGGPIYNLLMRRKEVSLYRYRDSTYFIVNKTDKWLNLNFVCINHRRQIVNDEVIELIDLCLTAKDKNGQPQMIDKTTLIINEYRFPNWINSSKAKKYRNYQMLNIAKKLMPDLA